MAGSNPKISADSSKDKNIFSILIHLFPYCHIHIKTHFKLFLRFLKKILNRVITSPGETSPHEGRQGAPGSRLWMVIISHEWKKIGEKRKKWEAKEIFFHRRKMR